MPTALLIFCLVSYEHFISAQEHDFCNIYNIHLCFILMIFTKAPE